MKSHLQRPQALSFSTVGTLNTHLLIASVIGKVNKETEKQNKTTWYHLKLFLEDILGTPKHIFLVANILRRTSRVLKEVLKNDLSIVNLFYKFRLYVTCYQNQ